MIAEVVLHDQFHARNPFIIEIAVQLLRSLQVTHRAWLTLRFGPLSRYVHAISSQKSQGNKVIANPLLHGQLLLWQNLYPQSQQKYQLKLSSKLDLKESPALQIKIQGQGQTINQKNIYLHQLLRTKFKGLGLANSGKYLRDLGMVVQIVTKEFTVNSLNFQNYQGHVFNIGQKTRIEVVPRLVPSNIPSFSQQLELSLYNSVLALQPFRAFQNTFRRMLQTRRCCVLKAPQKVGINTLLRQLCLSENRLLFKLNLQTHGDTQRALQLTKGRLLRGGVLLVKGAQQLTIDQIRSLRNWVYLVIQDCSVDDSQAQLQLQPFTKVQQRMIFEKVLVHHMITFCQEDMRKLVMTFSNLGWVALHRKIASSQAKSVDALLQSKAKEEQLKGNKISWTDIGGLEKAKSQVIDTIMLPELKPQFFDRRIRPRTGILFHGPPGTGKTLLAKCIANQCGMSFISVKGPQLLNMYVGQSEKNVRQIFKRALASRPCVLFFDELDSLAPKRGNSSDSQSVTDKLVSQLITSLDDISAKGGVYVVGATNRIDLLDDSLIRAGRFDKPVFLGLPDKQTRTLILKAQCSRLQLEEQVDLDKLGSCLGQGLSGADIYGITASAFQKVMKRSIRLLQQGEPEGELRVGETDLLQSIEEYKKK